MHLTSGLLCVSKRVSFLEHLCFIVLFAGKGAIPYFTHFPHNPLALTTIYSHPAKWMYIDNSSKLLL